MELILEFQNVTISFIAKKYGMNFFKKESLLNILNFVEQYNFGEYYI